MPIPHRTSSSNPLLFKGCIHRLSFFKRFNSSQLCSWDQFTKPYLLGKQQHSPNSMCYTSCSPGGELKGLKWIFSIQVAHVNQKTKQILLKQFESFWYISKAYWPLTSCLIALAIIVLAVIDASQNCASSQTSWGQTAGSIIVWAAIAMVMATCIALTSVWIQLLQKLCCQAATNTSSMKKSRLNEWRWNKSTNQAGAGHDLLVNPPHAQFHVSLCCFHHTLHRNYFDI